MSIFQLPRPSWVQDADALACRKCSSQFTQINRRHHCRQCGEIFCGNCCSKKMLLPQFGYDKPERVCDGCVEVAELVARSISDSIKVQVSGARGLAELAFKEGGLSKLANHGGIDALFHLSYMTDREISEIVSSAFEKLSSIAQIQNTLASKGILRSIYHMSTIQNQSTSVLLNLSKTLFQLSRSADLSEQILSEGGLHPILHLVTVKIPMTTPPTTKALEDISLTQGLAARTLSHISTNQKNQVRIIEDKRGALEIIQKLLGSQNEVVRKYIAKTFAYMSLRNDKLKVKIIQGSGCESILSVPLQPNTRLETVSHVCCTIANLATNSESQSILMNHPKLFQAIKASLSRFEDLEIKRHISRGIANFALYESNHLKLIEMVPTIIELGKCSSNEVSRHVVRAIDNFMATGTTKSPILEELKGQGIQFILLQISKSSVEEISKRAVICLKSLDEGNPTGKRRPPQDKTAEMMADDDDEGQEMDEDDENQSGDQLE